jgi:hypothetical protein
MHKSPIKKGSTQNGTTPIEARSFGSVPSSPKMNKSPSPSKTRKNPQNNLLASVSKKFTNLSGFKIGAKNRDLMAVSQRDASRDVSEADDESLFTDRSFFTMKLPLVEKLQKYMNRVATTCLGGPYAQKYMKELDRKERQNAKQAEKNIENEQLALLAAQRLGYP